MGNHQSFTGGRAAAREVMEEAAARLPGPSPFGTEGVDVLAGRKVHPAEPMALAARRAMEAFADSLPAESPGMMRPPAGRASGALDRVQQLLPRATP